MRPPALSLAHTRHGLDNTEHRTARGCCSFEMAERARIFGHVDSAAAAVFAFTTHLVDAGALCDRDGGMYAHVL